MEEHDEEMGLDLHGTEDAKDISLDLQMEDNAEERSLDLVVQVEDAEERSLDQLMQEEDTEEQGLDLLVQEEEAEEHNLDLLVQEDAELLTVDPLVQVEDARKRALISWYVQTSRWHIWIMTRRDVFYFKWSIRFLSNWRKHL